MINVYESLSQVPNLQCMLRELREANGGGA